MPAVVSIHTTRSLEDMTRVAVPEPRHPGEIPAARLHAPQVQLPALTRGEGVLETAFARYVEVRS